jgi:hypothetical protein
MSDLSVPPSATPAASFTPPVITESLLADCIGSILAGTPLPAEVRPTAAAASFPATMQDCIEQILRGRTSAS